MFLPCFSHILQPLRESIWFSVHNRGAVCSKNVLKLLARHYFKFFFFGNLFYWEYFSEARDFQIIFTPCLLLALVTYSVFSIRLPRSYQRLCGSAIGRDGFRDRKATGHSSFRGPMQVWPIWSLVLKRESMPLFLGGQKCGVEKCLILGE